MALDIKIKSNVRNLQARYIKFAHKFPNIINKGLLQAGENLVTAIKVRTDRGLDMNRQTFVSYSSGYAEAKGKSRVDLQDSNRMLQSIQSRLISKNKVRVDFRSPREAMKGFWHQTGAGNLPVRKFFGYDKRLENVIQKNFEKYIKQQIRGFGL